MWELNKRMIESEFEDVVGEKFVLTEPADRRIYGVDYMWLQRLYLDRGLNVPIPDYVVLPRNAEELSRIVRIANVYHLPIIPWGGGSGSQGGIVPVYGGITVDLKRMNRLIEINEQNMTVTAEAGISGFELERKLNQKGFTLGHIPASIHSATLGGYIAPRGSGVLSTQYGKIENIVLNLEAVLPNGDRVKTLPTPNHAAGPDIMHFFIGSEGVFGIITQATLKVQRVPEFRTFATFLFPDVESALKAGQNIMLERLSPAVIRVYDETETRKRIRKILGTEIDKGAYMVLGMEGRQEIVAMRMREAVGLCLEKKAEMLDEKSANDWWNHRYDFYYPPKTLDLPLMFGTMDTLCPFDRINELYQAKKENLETEFADYGLEYIAHFSHWYDYGVMVYDRFLVENPPYDAGEALKLHNRIWNRAVRLSLAHGGVLNEHHGVGLKLTRLVREQYGNAFQMLEALKNALDPNHILNPGKMGFGPTR